MQKLPDQIRIGGFIVERCTQDATVTVGTNFITNRSNKKENDGAICLTDGFVIRPGKTVVNVDTDLVDHATYQLDNLVIGPF